MAGVLLAGGTGSPTVAGGLPAGASWPVPRWQQASHAGRRGDEQPPDPADRGPPPQPSPRQHAPPQRRPLGGPGAQSDSGGGPASPQPAAAAAGDVSRGVHSYPSPEAMKVQLLGASAACSLCCQQMSAAAFNQLGNEDQSWWNNMGAGERQRNSCPAWRCAIAGPTVLRLSRMPVARQRLANSPPLTCVLVPPVA